MKDKEDRIDPFECTQERTNNEVLYLIEQNSKLVFQVQLLQDIKQKQTKQIKYLEDRWFTLQTGHCRTM